MKRRAVLAASVATISGLAGCSNSTEGVENTEDGSQTNTSTEDLTEESTSSSTESSTGQENQESFVWEDDLEEAIINSPLSDIAPEGPSGSPAEYLQLNETSNQINYPLSGNLESSYFDLQEETVLVNQGEDSVHYDSALFILTEDDISGSGDTELYLWMPVSDRWDSEADLRDNITQMPRTSLTYSEDDVSALMEESITDYDDASEDFPQEYLDMIEG